MDDMKDELLRLSSKALATSSRIYNIILEVGRGELTAHNALHQLVEDYYDLRLLGSEIDKAAEVVEKMQERIEELKHKKGGGE